jgi:hypothetical protein
MLSIKRCVARIGVFLGLIVGGTLVQACSEDPVGQSSSEDDVTPALARLEFIGVGAGGQPLAAAWEQAGQLDAGIWKGVGEFKGVEPREVDALQRTARPGELSVTSRKEIRWQRVPDASGRVHQIAFVRDPSSKNDLPERFAHMVDGKLRLVTSVQYQQRGSKWIPHSMRLTGFDSVTGRVTSQAVLTLTGSRGLLAAAADVGRSAARSLADLGSRLVSPDVAHAAAPSTTTDDYPCWSELIGSVGFGVATVLAGAGAVILTPLCLVDPFKVPACGALIGALGTSVTAFTRYLQSLIAFYRCLRAANSGGPGELPPGGGGKGEDTGGGGPNDPTPPPPLVELWLCEEIATDLYFCYRLI